MVSNLEPVVTTDGIKHKVTMFNSPDHSIEPLVDFINSAKKSIDAYIPDLVSWTYDSNTPRPPPEWVKEKNPLFQVLANTGVKKKEVLIRIVTNGPQTVLVPMMADMWEWLLLLNAQIQFTNTIKIGGILIIVDGGDSILLTSMDSSESSFVYNRESSIIMDQPNQDLIDSFQDAFNNDFMVPNSTPFIPPKETILGNPPLIDPVSAALIQAHLFEITSITQPPTVLVESPLPYVTDITVVEDAEFTLSLAGPNSVEQNLIQALQVPFTSFLQVGIRSISYTLLANTILETYKHRTNVTTVDLSYYLDNETEANESNKNLLTMKNDGMFGRLFLGPLYNEKPETKDYYTHSGQAYINSAGTLYFMTGSFVEDDITEKRNFYVAFRSAKMSTAITRLIGGDTLYATLFNGSDAEQKVSSSEQEVSSPQQEVSSSEQEPPSKK